MANKKFILYKDGKKVSEETSKSLFDVPIINLVRLGIKVKFEEIRSNWNE